MPEQLALLGHPCPSGPESWRHCRELDDRKGEKCNSSVMSPVQEEIQGNGLFSCPRGRIWESLGCQTPWSAQTSDLPRGSVSHGVSPKHADALTWKGCSESLLGNIWLDRISCRCDPEPRRTLPGVLNTQSERRGMLWSLTRRTWRHAACLVSKQPSPFLTHSLR